MVDILSQILNFLLSILTGIINAVLSFGNWFVGAIQWIIQAIINIVGWIASAIGTVLQFLGNLFVTIINTVIQVVGGLFVIVFMVIETMFHFISDIVSNIIRVIGIVELVFQAGLGIAGVVLSYLSQIIQIMIGIFNGINGAAPVPVDGLPKCLSAPLDWDWCALWYVFDWTVFAPGTPGAAIIPILVLIIDIFIVAYIARAIFKLVRWFQSLYQVA